MATEVSVTLRDCDIRRIEERAEVLGMTEQEYVSLALSVAEQLPDSLLFCLDAGVRVDFTATAEVGMEYV